MKFIHKKAADQRRENVNRMAGVVFGQQALRSYTAAQKKNNADAPVVIRPCARRNPPRAFPNIAQKVCFLSKQSTFNSLVGRVPRSKQKVTQWL